jgi:Fe-S cluster assembly iron-binding protein IscA
MGIAMFTEAAPSAGREVRARNGHHQCALRHAVSGGGYSGLRYPSTFDDHGAARDDRSRFGRRGLIVVAPRSEELCRLTTPCRVRAE